MPAVSSSFHPRRMCNIYWLVASGVAAGIDFTHYQTSGSSLLFNVATVTGRGKGHDDSPKLSPFSVNYLSHLIDTELNKDTSGILVEIYSLVPIDVRQPNLNFWAGKTRHWVESNRLIADLVNVFWRRGVSVHSFRCCQSTADGTRVKVPYRLTSVSERDAEWSLLFRDSAIRLTFFRTFFWSFRLLLHSLCASLEVGIRPQEEANYLERHGSEHVKHWTMPDVTANSQSRETASPSLATVLTLKC